MVCPLICFRSEDFHEGIELIDYQAAPKDHCGVNKLKNFKVKGILNGKYN
ncbi:unnamed protein product [marine sediment metagenome]|uniref:Uncharacterized protein n=1 Tax=marine sediment metagenome TaxID=412755 RepID=X1MWL4_9ZZZZ